MIRKPLVVINAVLVAIDVVLIGFIGYAVLGPLPDPAPVAARPPLRLTEPAPPPRPLVGPAAYSIVATRNLFSPTRDEASTAAAAAQAVSQPVVPAPRLYGVLLREETPIAYLEDPVTKRVAGYHIGDAIGGGTLATIAADRVVLERPQGMLDVRLHDPSKPKQPAPAPVAAAPAPGQTGERGPGAPSRTPEPSPAAAARLPCPTAAGRRSIGAPVSERAVRVWRVSQNRESLGAGFSVLRTTAVSLRDTSRRDGHLARPSARPGAARIVLYSGRTIPEPRRPGRRRYARTTAEQGTECRGS
jgi:hypothetical protein